jgi:hypothetical protein
MKHNRLFVGTLLAVISGLALSHPAAAHDQVPFKAHAVSETIATTAFPIVTIDVRGSGVATHLGRFTQVQQHFINLLGDPLGFYGGVYTFIGANGDTLIGGYGGRLVPTSMANVYLIDGAFTIEGGTGRFAGASGSGEASGVTDLSTGAVNLVLDGAIRSPGSLK